jgi:ATP-dependent helicase Lhr and Lhr-like helicase
MSLTAFHPATQHWFSETLGEPTAAQSAGWAAIRQGSHVLIAAPTGSGKTLAAFLTALDDLFQEGLRGPLPDEARVVYVSPLKALSADIHKNLAEPRRGIRRAAESLGLATPRVTAAVRTGDTPQTERAAMLRVPPHIVVTTPESLYLLLTSAGGREMLRTVRTVIVDEIHAVIGTRRGAHLALSIERLQHLTGRPLQRIGLSATQKPIEEVARFLVGSAHIDEDGLARCTIVDSGHRRSMDLSVEIPRSPLEAVMAGEVWEEYYDRLAELVGRHRTTLVFVNTRRLAERVARHLSERLGEETVTAHHGSLSKEKRLDAEARLKHGQLKALVATASLELGIDIGHVDLVCQIGSPRRIATLIQRVGRSGHSISGLPKGRLFPISRDDLIECAALLRSVRLGALDRVLAHDEPLDVLTQQIVAETASRDCEAEELFELVRRAWPYRALTPPTFDAVVAMAADGFATRRGRRAALVHRDEVNGRLRGRRGARLLALTSGGAIPDVADYRVLLDPDETFVGTLNEDFAIESAAGDVFQLGNASWRVLQVAQGTVRVADAKGAPPTIPFWIGEAPARSDELSGAVSTLRKGVDASLDVSPAHATAWLTDETGLPFAAAEQAVAYLADAKRALGVLPTTDTLVLERFFDESGGMQLVLHAPFGSRVNKAWGLALRKRFCRQFNFELQAAATDDALLLSLGPQHSFPLADVFRYLHPATARDVLVQALLDAPVFQTRWRWNTTVALAVPRYRGGRKVPAPLQRMLADDLMAAAFPDAAACLENIPGDRSIPDHPLVTQTLRDCLQEAMDFEGLSAVLARVHRGELQLISRDTPEPSPLAHEILNARPYAFLDDAPLEERRTHAVYTRRAGEPASEFGRLDQDAIARVRDEARPDPRDAEELHDALVTFGFLRPGEIADGSSSWLEELLAARRAAVMEIATVPSSQPPAPSLWLAAERLPEIRAVHPGAGLHGTPATPASREQRAWTRQEAVLQLLRGRMEMCGPITASGLAASLGVPETDAEDALLALEADGAVLRGRFTSSADPVAPLEWCDRRLLARIHRYTLNRLRAEIEPVSPADFMRFLFVWQHADASCRLTGLEGLRATLAALDGFELAATAWERAVLPLRVDRYERSLLDLLCLTGEAGWARLSAPTTDERARIPALGPSTPVALFVREHGPLWRALRDAGDAPAPVLSDPAKRVLAEIDARGALFARELALACRMDDRSLADALGQLASAGLIASDGFAGLRDIVRKSTRPSATRRSAAGSSGRWGRFVADSADDAYERAVDAQARTLLRRYGVVCRRLLAREANAAPWRDLARIYRRLEARGEIRGGRFVAGLAGEQYAMPEAVERLREVRRTPATGRIVTVSGADPLNLTGIVTSGERVKAIGGYRIAYRNGVPVAALEGGSVRPLAPIDREWAGEISSALTGRKLPAVTSGYVGVG